MRRTFVSCVGFLQNLKPGKDKFSFFTSLWNRPETRDERIKDYIPEVLEESLEEQRKVFQESTSRDVIVQCGRRVLVEIERKSPTPNILPHLSKIMFEYGAKNLIAQRSLSYLLYPSTVALGGDTQPHDLVATFADNFRSLIEQIELHGCSARLGAAQRLTQDAAQSQVHKIEDAPSHAGEEKEGVVAKQRDSSRGCPVSRSPAALGSELNLRTDEQTNVGRETLQTANGQAQQTPTLEEADEPADVTMFVKVVTGMALANLHCGDLANAVRCVDTGITRVVDSARRGALLGLKAGLLIRQGKLEEAVEVSKLAVEASGNVQGYLHGAYALRRLHLPGDAIALLEKGAEDHPMDTSIAAQLEAANKEVRLSLPLP